MPTIQDQISNIHEQMIYLCEVRGELHTVSNVKSEVELNQLSAELQELHFEQDQAVMDFSCDL